MDKFGPELLVIQFGFLVILSTLFLWLWFSNRRKYHNLKHAIPANIVKSYLDSIIQNSTSLKSSLFRGGGLEVGGVPSVLPLSDLMSGGESIGISGAPSTAMIEEVNQKKALISSLESQLHSAQNAQREMDSKLKASQSGLNSAEARIKELEALLAAKPGGSANASASAATNSTSSSSSSGGGDDSALKSQLAAVTKERDELLDRLKEFEIIADDLANLKRLQQENEQLKRSLAAQGGSAPVSDKAPENAQIDTQNILNQADVSGLLEGLGSDAPDETAEDNKALEDFLSSPDESAQAEVLAEADAPAEPDKSNKSDKTSEDLLSEFEKMLG